MPVFYGTNRVRIGTARYGSFGATAGPMRYGVAYVTIPRGHTVGAIERPNWLLQAVFGENADRHITIKSIAPLSGDTFFGRAGGEMARIAAAIRRPRSAMLFVHGFNVKFDDAAMRTGQMAHDVGFEGAPFLFSWPSQGTPFKLTAPTAPYRHDARMIAASQAPLERFITDVLDRAKPDKLFIVAHSMGARGTALALAHLSQTRPDLRRRIAALILAAPDIRQDVFRSVVAPGLARLAGGVTTYSSSRDRALMVSAIVNKRYALGDARGGPVIVSPMDMIDVSEVETDWLGHSAYGSEASLLGDIKQIMGGAAASARFGLKRRSSPAGTYYVYARVR